MTLLLGISAIVSAFIAGFCLTLWSLDPRGDCPWRPCPLWEQGYPCEADKAGGCPECGRTSNNNNFIGRK